MSAVFKGPWRHRESGRIYTVLFVAEYRGRNKIKWTRPVSEWAERFEFAATIHYADVGETPTQLLYNATTCSVPSWAHYGSSDPAKVTCNACLALMKGATP